ncbi:MAG: 3-deoxy-manno-octulosonate cytidylyltransferase [Bacteroidales bacterium]|nr:3-deoxy-manno-octulosonate cytidylyltransferase [Bacteroidales bacterium]
MNFLGIIPARYASTRFPGKPLVMINGKSMIQRVYEQVSKASILSDIIIATDDKKIEEHVGNFGAKVIMTSPHHNSGTERCNEVIEILKKKFPEKIIDVVINIQGDEPYINPKQIEEVASCFINKEVQIASLLKEISSKEELFNHNVVKVVINNKKQAIYFSRFPIPFFRGKEEDNCLNKHIFYKHIGIYAYRTEILNIISKLEQSSLEIAESLEQLRWIENGYKINIEFTKFESYSIDTPDDLLKLTNKI